MLEVCWKELPQESVVIPDIYVGNWGHRRGIEISLEIDYRIRVARLLHGG
jgi:hypothetical protein